MPNTLSAIDAARHAWEEFEIDEARAAHDAVVTLRKSLEDAVPGFAQLIDATYCNAMDEGATPAEIAWALLGIAENAAS